MPSPVDPAALRPEDLPIRLGRYTLEGLLGRGGAGQVYRSTLHGPAGFRKRLAVKVLGAGARTELAEEARLGALLEHPNLVDVFDLCEVQGRWLVVMEWVRGPSLHRLLADHGPLPGLAVLQVARQVCRALHHAHGLVVDGQPHPVVHRDLKPANVLLTPAGVVKLADLGIAALAGTTDEHTMGTPAYMSPEQLSGAPVDPGTDQFALGLVIVEMCTGTRLLGGRGMVAALTHLSQLEQRLQRGQVAASVDRVVPGLADIVTRCLATEVADRYPDCGAIERALKELQGSGASLGQLCSDPTSADPTSSEAPTVTPTATSEAPTRVLPRTNLPPPVPMFGREAELGRLAERLSTGRLVTVHGPGGMGKTTLVRRFGAESAAQWTGGVWFCDLSGVRHGAGICFVVADVLGVVLGQGTDEAVARQLGRQLASRGPLLLVLDNLEQVIGPVSELLAVWLELAPQVRFVGTSRIVLRLPEEQVLPLGPLPEPEAVALLQERAADRGGEPWSSADATPTLAELARRLDGLPLALELAAARAGLMSPSQVLQRLSQRFRVLSTGPRGAPDRQATLRGALDWSWDLLEPVQRSALAQLSVFRGGFSLDAAEGVVDLDGPDAPWVLDVVGALHDQALVARGPGPDGQPRFTLYESVRDYAAERVVHSDGLELRHARWFARHGRPEALARHLPDPGRRRLARDLENLVHGTRLALRHDDLDAAAGCARAAGEVFGARGPFVAGLQVVRPVLQRVGDDVELLWVAARLALLSGRPEGLAWARRAVELASDDRERALAHTVLGELLMHRGRAEEALEESRAALHAAERWGDQSLVGSAAMGVGIALRQTGESRAALQVMMRARDCAAQARDVRRLGSALVGLGELSLSLGEFELARQSLERALGEVDEAPNVVANAYGNLGILCRQTGDLAGARHHYREALRRYRQLGKRRDEGIVLSNLGVLSQHEGRLHEAEDLFLQARRIGDEIDDLRMRANATLNLSDVLERRGPLSVARAALEESRADYVLVPAPVAVGLIDISLSDMDWQRGDFAQALELAEAGLELVREAGARRYVVLGLGRRANALLGLGRAAEAESEAEAAVALAREVGDPQIMAYALLHRCRCLAARDPVAAEAVGRESIQSFLRAGDTHGRALGRVEVCRLLLAMGRHDEALQAAEQVLAEDANQALGLGVQAAVVRAHVRVARGVEGAGEELDEQLRVLEELGYLTAVRELRGTR